MKNILSKLNPFHKSRVEKFFSFIKKYKLITLILLLVLAGAISAKTGLIGNNTPEETKNEKIKQVKTITIGNTLANQAEIKTVGSVNAQTTVDITASTRGTVRGLFFEIGDQVELNQLLAILYDSSTLTSLNNAQTNYMNMQNNYSATERISEESIKQAEIGVTSAKEAVNAAEISVKTVTDNLENSKTLRKKSNADTKTSAVVSFNGQLSTILNSLNQVNYLLGVEGNLQLPNVNSVLAARNTSSLDDAKADYRFAKNAYDELKALTPNQETITANMKKMVTGLALTEKMVSNTLVVLDNTVTSSSFNEAALNAQKSNFIALHSTIVNTQTAAEGILNNLQNLDLIYHQEIGGLENALEASRSQLEIAKTNYQNALTSLESVRQGKKQQIVSSQTALDNAQGQLNLAQTQAGDLTIKAPIKGQITKKYIEVGAEVNSGQKIAEIQQANTIKIIVSLPSEEVYRIEIGQTVKISDNLEGIISSINPAADPITRKVSVEIIFDNKDKDLIPGTFVDVVIPVKQLEKTNANSIFVPLRAVNITQNNSYVFLVENNQAKKYLVTTGKTEGAMIEVITGLKNGDILVIDGGRDLEDNEIIEINN